MQENISSEANKMNDLKNKLSFPIKQELSTDFLQNNFWKCRYNSAGDELDYLVILPNNVKPTKIEPLPIENTGLTRIGQYISVDESPYLEVQVVYEHCPYEMNASDWIAKTLHITNESVINYRLIEGDRTGKYADALTYKKFLDGNEVISRLTVFKDSDAQKGGANYFCIKASCALVDYNQLANHIFQIVANWYLINKVDYPMAELLRTFTLNSADFPDEKVSFYLPASWEMHSKTTDANLNSHVVFTHPVGEFNKGTIHAFFYQGNTVKDVNEIMVRRLATLAGYKIELNDLEKSETRNPFIDELYLTQGYYFLEEEDYKPFVRIAIIKTKQGWYFFECTGTNVNLENYYWEINKRCMELIQDSFNNPEF